MDELPYYIDTHCHLNFSTFQNDIKQVILKAYDAGVQRILIPGIDLATSKQAVELAEIHSEIFAAVGIHPNEAESWTVETKYELKHLAENPKVVAIGEIGLDYFRNRASKERQKSVLLEQLKLSLEIKKPIIIHNRHASADLWEILQNWQSRLHENKSPIADHPGVFHSFDENLDHAMRIIVKGFMIGINGPVTYKNAIERQNLARELPIESLLLETDAPFLPPHPHRGERNEPVFITLIAAKIAKLREMDISELASTTTRNANRLFNWSESV